MTASPIVLLTDFGYIDEYAGVLKGVILRVNPLAQILDLTHGIPPQDLVRASFVLTSSVSYFPRSSIFLVVVDPGVGTSRKPLLVKAGEYFFMGPDNGVLYPVASQMGDVRIFCLDHPEYFLPSVSSTFHGRDIFAPVAAHLSLGTAPEVLGTPVDHMESLDIPRPVTRERGLDLCVLFVDTFGNMILNLTAQEFAQWQQPSINIQGKNGIHRITRVCSTYAQAPDNEPFLLISSSGHVEMAVKNQSAWEFLGLDSLETSLWLEGRKKGFLDSSLPKSFA